MSCFPSLVNNSCFKIEWILGDHPDSAFSAECGYAGTRVDSFIEEFFLSVFGVTGIQGYYGAFAQRAGIFAPEIFQFVEMFLKNSSCFAFQENQRIAVCVDHIEFLRGLSIVFSCKRENRIPADVFDLFSTLFQCGKEILFEPFPCQEFCQVLPGGSLAVRLIEFLYTPIPLCFAHFLSEF